MFPMYIVLLATVYKLHYPRYLSFLTKGLYRIKANPVVVSWVTWIVL